MRRGLTDSVMKRAIAIIFLGTVGLYFLSVSAGVLKHPPQHHRDGVQNLGHAEHQKLQEDIDDEKGPIIEDDPSNVKPKPPQPAGLKDQAQQLPNPVHVKDVPDDKTLRDNQLAKPQKTGSLKLQRMRAAHNGNKTGAHKHLNMKELQPPDHLDAVKMEQDGHLNRDYKKEIFLGNHEEIETGTKEEIEEKLKEIFEKVDKDRNDYIDQSELEEWIVTKVKEHFSEADEENMKIFRALDDNGDNYVSWKEFHVEFLLAKGHERELAEKQSEDYDAIPLEPEDKDKLIRYKFRWADADEDPQDNQLTLQEFRNFRHPEQSSQMLKRMVQDIIDNLDRDHNDEVTEDEFAALPPGEVETTEFKESDKLWQEERRKEFRNIIDTNHDGKVTRQELKNYVDPQNPNHSLLEAKNLITLADSNKDGRLSWPEILDNQELFLGSKMVDTGRSFHDEF